MSAVQGPQGLTHAAPRDPREQLKKVSHQMEGVFLNQLFQAMRASVPHEDSGEGQGEEMFSSMLDQRIADVASQRTTHGPGEALYRQLLRRMEAADAKSAPQASAAHADKLSMESPRVEKAPAGVEGLRPTFHPGESK